ncbi:MAG: outer membrane protein assembly factor BamE [Candidatus Rokubacteria bacterium]|nr:outer membrane protein assembly factor BamE [Candidatus Rokubacteria bacterium]
MRRAARVLAALSLAAATAGCTTAAQHQQRLGSAAEREMTLGVVQKELRAGLTQSEVIAALGSPNIVTRDPGGRETWVYDKVASEASYSRSAMYGTVLLLGGASAAGAASQSQRTLTVVVKFDPAQRVETFSYHASRF